MQDSRHTPLNGNTNMNMYIFIYMSINQGRMYICIYICVFTLTKIQI